MTGLAQFPHSTHLMEFGSWGIPSAGSEVLEHHRDSENSDKRFTVCGKPC